MSFLSVDALKVRSLDLDFHEISWRIGSEDIDVLDYTFQILRSESPSGPFDELTVPFEDKYFFIDNELQVAHRWRKYYYLLRVARKGGGPTKDFGPISREPEADILALEIRRHMNLLFREFAGRRNWILPVRTFGQRCSCFDRKLQRRRISNCLLCFDTGFVRGYLSPIETWVQFDPSVKNNQYTNVAQMQQVNTTARLGYYPQLKPNDLIVEPENRRWKVVSVSQTEQGRAVLHQEIQIHEVPPRDIEFQIPLDLGVPLKDLWLNPARNFSNPQNLEAYENEELPNVIDLYSKFSRPR